MDVSLQEFQIKFATYMNIFIVTGSARICNGT